jgi:hypothetical protein
VARVPYNVWSIPIRHVSGLKKPSFQDKGAGPRVNSFILQLREGMRVDYYLEYSVSLMFESKDLDEFRTPCKIVLGETLAAWGVRPSLNKGHQTKSRNVDGSGIACDRR